MKNMTFAVSASLLLACPAAFADQAPPHPEKDEAQQFQMMKEHMLKDIESQISMLQKFHDCMAAAADREAARMCHEQQEVAMRARRASERQERLRHIEDQQKALEKEKQRLEQEETKPDAKPDQKP